MAELIMNDKFTHKYTEVYATKPINYNAYHDFNVVRKSDMGIVGQIHFQEGPIKECGVNGVCNEDLILMVITRLEQFQQSEFKCDENQEAIDKLYEAIAALRSRTTKRENRGVEGTHIV